MIYLDNASTTKVMKSAAEGAVNAMLSDFGNPSSLHGMGIQAQRMIEFSKRQILMTLCDTEGELIFTSGATESNNTAILGLAGIYGKRKKRVVTTTVEHPSVSEAFKKLTELGYEVVTVSPDQDGEIGAEALINAVDSNTCLISAMLVNNETGYILPIEKAFSSIKRRYPECHTHCDCVQGFEKLRISAKKLCADAISISGHKIYAPKGVGALYIRKGIRIYPVMLGGGQQKGLRSGTEAVPLIYALGKAVQELSSSIDERYSHVLEINSYARDKLSEIGVVIISKDCSSPYILSICVPKIKSETMLHYLESNEIYVSSGSACSKGKKSSVLAEFRIPEKYLDSIIRLSFSNDTLINDIDILAKEMSNGMTSLAKIR